MINLKDTESVEFTENVRKFIEPGIQEVKITNITFVEGQTGKSGRLQFTWTKGEQTTEDSLFTSENALPYTLKTIKHLTNVISGEDTNVTGKDYTELAKNLLKTIGNKTYRHKFHGREIAGKEGKNNWWKAVFGPVMPTNRLAEPLTTTPTQLRFNSKSNFDMKPLVTPDTVSNGVTNEEMPF